MKLLAIETATGAVGCALWSDGALLASFSLVAGARHAEVLMPAIDYVCRQAGVAASDIEAVAVDNGPGLFTGLRVGMATAHAIAAARGIPAVGVSSLDALAHPQRRRPGLVAAVVDARRKEVFWALYASDGDRLEKLRPPAVADPEALATELAALAQTGQRAQYLSPSGPGERAQYLSPSGPGVLAVGDGAWRYRDQLAQAGAVVAGGAEMWPSPITVAELGWQFLTDNGPPADLPAPLYLRQADVRIGWEEVSGRVERPAAGGRAAAAPAPGRTTGANGPRVDGDRPGGAGRNAGSARLGA